MYCKRCHREIKNPKSVQKGYGPVCWSKMLAAHPVAVGKTNNEKSFVPIFEQLLKEKTKKEPDKDDPQIWTTAHGRTVIL